MSFNPESKMRKLREAKEIARTIKRKRPKGGPLSQVEKAVIATIVNDREVSHAQSVALAVALDRKPDTILETVRTAKDRLAGKAIRYADLHMESLESALANNDPDVARKGAEWALSKISATDDTGKRVHVIDPSTADGNDNRPHVIIGIGLGAMKALTPGERTQHAIDVESVPVS